MASNTEILNLYKKDPIADKDETFNIQTMMNDNWVKIDQFAGETNTQLAQDTLNLQNHVNLKKTDNPHNLKFRGVLLRKVSNQSVQNDADTIIGSWGSPSYDTSNFWNISFPSRLTIPNGVSKIILKTQSTWADNDIGDRQVEFRKNGGAYFEVSIERKKAARTSGMIIFSPVLEVIEGDYFEVRVRQTSGNSLDFGGASWFAMEVVE